MWNSEIQLQKIYRSSSGGAEKTVPTLQEIAAASIADPLFGNKEELPTYPYEIQKLINEQMIDIEGYIFLKDPSNSYITVALPNNFPRKKVGLSRIRKYRTKPNIPENARGTVISLGTRNQPLRIRNVTRIYFKPKFQIQSANFQICIQLNDFVSRTDKVGNYFKGDSVLESANLDSDGVLCMTIRCPLPTDGQTKVSKEKAVETFEEHKDEIVKRETAFKEKVERLREWWLATS